MKGPPVPASGQALAHSGLVPPHRATRCAAADSPLSGGIRPSVPRCFLILSLSSPVYWPSLRSYVVLRPLLLTIADRRVSTLHEVFCRRPPHGSLALDHLLSPVSPALPWPAHSCPCLGPSGRGVPSYLLSRVSTNAAAAQLKRSNSVFWLNISDASQIIYWTNPLKLQNL